MLKLELKQAEVFATRADFCRVFKDEMTALYLLAFLLTANHAKAEECFLAALADAGNASVFREFAASWCRRLIIAHAIRLTTPTSSREAETSERWGEAESDSSCLINRVAQLTPLERFAFVLTVLERHRDVECAILLGRTRKEITQARARALEDLASVNPRPMLVEKPPPSNRRDERAASATPPAA